MTASSTRRSRGVSSSGVVISSNMLTTSVMRQGGGERIEAQPAQGRAAEAVILIALHPSCDFPRRDQVTLAALQGEAQVAPQAEVDCLRCFVCRSERLDAL